LIAAETGHDLVRQIVVISLMDRLTAKQDPNYGDTERWEPYDN